jgi:hypothetical protein
MQYGWIRAFVGLDAKRTRSTPALRLQLGAVLKRALAGLIPWAGILRTVDFSLLLRPLRTNVRMWAVMNSPTEQSLS